jgi:hypothetical protein
VKNRFHNLPFKFNLQRYSEGGDTLADIINGGGGDGDGDKEGEAEEEEEEEGEKGEEDGGEDEE